VSAPPVIEGAGSPAPAGKREPVRRDAARRDGPQDRDADEQDDVPGRQGDESERRDLYRPP